MNKKICSCGKVMRFVKTKNNKPMPVNEDSLHPDEVSALDNGMDVDYDPTRQVSHFVDCPEAKKFRNRGKEVGGRQMQVFSPQSSVGNRKEEGK